MDDPVQKALDAYNQQLQDEPRRRDAGRQARYNAMKAAYRATLESIREPDDETIIAGRSAAHGHLIKLAYTQSADPIDDEAMVRDIATAIIDHMREKLDDHEDQ